MVFRLDGCSVTTAHGATAPEVDPGVEDEQDEDGDESVDEEVHVG